MVLTIGKNHSITLIIVRGKPIEPPRELTDNQDKSISSKEAGLYQGKSHPLLPNYCGIRQIGLLVALAQLLSILLTILSYDFWASLALISLYVQFVVLSCAVLLCLLRHWLQSFSVIKSLVFSYLIILLVVLLISEISYQSYAMHMDHGLFQLRNLFIGAILAGVYLRYLYVQYQWQTNVEAEAQARLQSLQARIRPHFLFNSMNTITSLIRSQPELAEKLMTDLADLFRQGLKESDSRVPLKHELSLVRSYLNIEQLRLDQRLKIHWQWDELPQDALIPPLSIQPLVENAVYHGIEPLVEGGEIQLMGRYQDDSLEITIENPNTAQRSERRGNHIAQQNIASRLLAWYGNAAYLKVEQDDQVYRVILKVPYEQ